MKTKWGLQIIDRAGLKTPEDWMTAFNEAKPIFFRTVSECFDYLGFKLTRAASGYGGSDAKHGYCLMKYRA